MPFNYYQTKLAVVTARRAKLMGLDPSRHYGYYVTITPKPPHNGGNYQGVHADIGIHSWCATKSIAENQVKRDNEVKQKGQHGCLCGSNLQARGCCGRPSVISLS